ncbi:MAG: insulinase family protein [Clostridiales bacterium]|nr:insulinase family protein [Clostridiales bacterium]
MIKILESDILGEKIHFKRLKNGLEIYVLPKPGFYRKSAIYATKYGSNDISFIVPGESEVTDVPLGIAHFLEHKAFEEPEGDVFEMFSNLGADPNASTGYDATSYYFTTTENFYESLDLLLGFVNRPYFTDENVEKEKGIITQELLMYEDNAHWMVYFNLLRGLYEKHPVRNDIGGTIESIQTIDKDMLYRTYNTFYHPSNMVLFAVGDIAPEKVFMQAKAQFKEDLKEQSEIERITYEEPKGVFQNEIRHKMPISRPIFAIGYKDIPIYRGGKELLKKIIVNGIVSDMTIGSTSDLYSELYEKGLIDGSFSGGYTGEKDYSYMVLSGETRDVDLLVDELQNGIEDIKRKGPDKDLFLQAKRGRIGRFIRYFDHIGGLGPLFVSLYIKESNLFDYIEVLDSITYEDVKIGLENAFVENRRVVSVVEP